MTKFQVGDYIETTWARDKGSGVFKGVVTAGPFGFAGGGNYHFKEDKTGKELITLGEDCKLITRKEETVKQYKVGDIVPEHLLRGLQPLPDKNATELGFKVGDKFVVLAGCYFNRGKVIELYRDDRSTNPRFTNGTTRYYKSFHLLAPLSQLTNQSKENKSMAKRTFKLKVETPGLKKGAILQEECEDGTQPYSLLDDSYSKDSSYKVRFSNRSLVEDAPKFFVEVFKVQPEYLTKEELDRWEAFKKTLKGTKAKKSTKKTTRKYVKSGKYAKKNN